MSEDIGGMNSKIPELARKYAEMLASQKRMQEDLRTAQTALDELGSQLISLAIEINAAAGKSYHGPNIVEISPGRALLIEYEKGIREVNVAVCR